MTRSELLKTAKPILFNTDMVRAILDGRKTVTRRVLKNQDENAFTYDWNYKDDMKDDVDIICDRNGEVYALANKPPCHTGDILYVRETWCWCPCWDCGLNEPEIGCAEPTARMTFHSQKKEYGCIGYKASFAENEQPPGLETWKPSIHMPKEAARIFLRVTDVRVERLKDISNSSAWGEGVTSWNGFVQLWNSTVKKSDLDRYGWAANPWVWVIEFEKLEVQE
ncbi:MAG: hypothetical protein J6A19_15535 [Oscillospiraceae bacterium]|nr:hypothetical protein [Oscillospiraceae bacterium]